MKKVLWVTSSINLEKSASTKLSKMVIEHLQKKEDGLTIKNLDIVKHSIPHLIGSDFQNISDNEYLKDFLESDIVVIAAPMYNFSIPSQLKSWLDRLIVSGVTFKYDENGPKGLLTDKKIIIASARGSIFDENSSMDHQESLLKNLFSFMGITDIQIVRVEGLGMGEENVSKAFSLAEIDIKKL